MSKLAFPTRSISWRERQGTLPRTTSLATMPGRGSTRIDRAPRTSKSRPVGGTGLGRQQGGPPLRREPPVQRDVKQAQQQRAAGQAGKKQLRPVESRRRVRHRGKCKWPRKNRGLRGTIVPRGNARRL
jgi:hypothetical protein